LLVKLSILHGILFNLNKSNLLITKIDSFAGHRGAIYALHQGMEDHLFFSAGSDGWLVQWNLQKPDLGKVVAQVEGTVFAMFLDKESEIVWVGQNNQGIHGISLNDQNRVFSLKMVGLSIFDMVQFQGHIWVAHNNGLISVFDLATRTTVKHLKGSNKNARKLLVLNDDVIAVAYSDGFIRLFNGKFELIDFWLAHENSVFSLAFHQETSELISVGRDAKIKKWKINQSNFKQNSLEVVGHIYTINEVVLNPTGELFATASRDKTIKIWQRADLKLLKVIDAKRHGGHINSVNKLIWTNFHNQLVSASDDKNIAVWTIE
jgi:WD40 repeat protein